MNLSYGEINEPIQKPERSYHHEALEVIKNEYEEILDALKWDENWNRLNACKRLIKYIESKIEPLENEYQQELKQYNKWK